jgi:Ser/Thr protein kinase RdoA (MazF antagonist)
MKNSFKRDFFSKKIIWNKKNLINQKKFCGLKLFIEKKKINKIIYIKQNAGIESNSQNFKIKINKNIYFLKKWSSELSHQKIDSIIKFNQELHTLGSLVPKIIKIDGSTRFKIGENYWTLYTFINAYHFSGSNDEIRNLAFEIGKFFKILKKVNKNQKLKVNPTYYDRKSKIILKKIINNKENLESIFGVKLGKQVRNGLKLIKNTYFSNTKKNNLPKTYQVAHFDLHPNNILVKNHKVVTFLDIDSCTKMNAGYALAFSCLKICKQTICKKRIKKLNKIKEQVEIFRSNVSKNYPEINILFPHFFYFSTSEVLRRILLIFEQNLKGIKTWNKVLKIQIDHLSEANLLFK